MNAGHPTEDEAGLLLKDASETFAPGARDKEEVRKALRRRLRSEDTPEHRPQPIWARLARRTFAGVKATTRAQRLVAAAVIAATVAAVIGWLAPGNRRPGLLFADVLEKVRSVRSVKFTSTVTMEGGPGRTAEILRLEPGRSRITEAGTGMVIIIDRGQGRSLALLPDTKKATLTVFEGPAEPAGDQQVALLDKITKLREGAGQELGQRVIDRRTVSGFRGRLEGSEWVVWADSQTGLPVRIETTSPLVAPGCRMVMTDFEWGVALDESLFSLTPPEGYRVEEKHVPASPPLAEGDLVEGLKFWAQRMDSTFPPAFVALPMLQGLQERLRAEYQRQFDEEVAKEGASRDFLKQRDIMGKVNERVYGGPDKKVWRMVEFAGDQDEWRYVGKDVRLGEAAKPVCWWRPKGSKTYRVLYGDLTVRDVTPDSLPSLPIPEAMPPVPEKEEHAESATTQHEADLATCKLNLKQIGIAIFMYLQAHDHQYPNSLDDLVTYLEGRRPLICPGSGEEGYVYEKPATPFLKVVEPRSAITVYDKPGNHEGGRNVLFLDGHVQWLTEEEFQKRWAQQEGRAAPKGSASAGEGHEAGAREGR